VIGVGQMKIEGGIHCLFFQVRQQIHQRRSSIDRTILPDGSRRQLLVHVFVVVHRKSDLPQIVGATCSPSRFTSRLDGRQQKRDQNSDDRNHDQHFDQRECATARKIHHLENFIIVLPRRGL